MKNGSATVALLLFMASLCFAQTQKTSLIPVSVSVESEGQEVLWPAGMREVGRLDVALLKMKIGEELSKQKDAIVLVDPKTPGNQLNVSVVVAQLEDKWYVASSALQFGDEKTSGLLSHNVLIQPSIQELAREVAFQVLSLRLGAVFGTLGKP